MYLVLQFKHLKLLQEQKHFKIHSNSLTYFLEIFFKQLNHLVNELKHHTLSFTSVNQNNFTVPNPVTNTVHKLFPECRKKISNERPRSCKQLVIDSTSVASYTIFHESEVVCGKWAKYNASLLSS